MGPECLVSEVEALSTEAGLAPKAAWLPKAGLWGRGTPTAKDVAVGTPFSFPGRSSDSPWQGAIPALAANQCRGPMQFKEDAVVRRKLTSFLVTTLVLSSLAIVGELAILWIVRAPAPSYAGAYPQASGQIYRGARFAPTAAGPLSSPSRVGLAEWGWPQSRQAVALGAAHRMTLWAEPSPGQPDRQGEYANRTDPVAAEPTLAGVAAAVRGRTPTLLLGALMALAVLALAGRGAEAEKVAPRQGGATHRAPRTLPGPGPALGRGQQPAPWPGRTIILLGCDRAAEWERVRLVPT